VSDSFVRRVWQWHFWAGLIAGPVLIVIAVTGGIYTFREEIEDAERRGLVFVAPAGARRPVDELLTAVKTDYPDQTPVRVIVPADPGRSTVVLVQAASGPASGAGWAVFVDPYTGAVLGDGPVRTPFFAGVLRLHRSLFAGAIGRILVELTTSWVIVLLLSGVVLWWPKRLTRVWGVWLPRVRGPGYVLLRDLHTVPGLYLTPVAGLIAATGLFYTLVWHWGYNRVTGGAGDFPAALRTAPPVQPPSTQTSPLPLEVALTAARERWPDKSYTMDLQATPAHAYTVTVRGDRGPFVQGMVALDPYTGVVTADNRFEDLPPLQWARTWVHPVHTGTVGGTPTKILACLTCLVLAGLAVSGMWMWLARRPRGQLGFPPTVETAIPRPAIFLIILLAVLLPTFGISLAALLVGEWVLQRLRRRLPHPRHAGACQSHLQSYISR
jgi:uncharacterized iron-regulated membrane protein